MTDDEALAHAMTAFLDVFQKSDLNFTAAPGSTNWMVAMAVGKAIVAVLKAKEAEAGPSIKDLPQQRPVIEL